MLEQAPEHRHRGDPGRPRPDAFHAGEHPLRLENLRILDVGGEPVVLAEQAQDPIALPSRVAGGEAFGHGVADLERRDRRPVAERARDRVGAGGLRGHHSRSA